MNVVICWGSKNVIIFKLYRGLNSCSCRNVGPSNVSLQYCKMKKKMIGSTVSNKIKQTFFPVKHQHAYLENNEILELLFEFILSSIACSAHSSLETIVLISIINPLTKFNRNLLNVTQRLMCTLQRVCCTSQQNVCTAKSFRLEDVWDAEYLFMSAFTLCSHMTDFRHSCFTWGLRNSFVTHFLTVVWSCSVSPQLNKCAAIRESSMLKIWLAQPPAVPV